MARLRLLLLFISLFLLTSPSLISSADESDIPYIYYYANTANALVVERADGTDSRLIAPGAMPPDHSVISDLDWSPSGQWMAWRSGVYNPYGGVIGFSAWIARADGSDRLTLLDNVGRIFALKWSPNDDLLYVAYVTNHLVLTLNIIDPDANAIIAQTEYALDLLFESFPTGWFWDGNGIYFRLYLGNTNIVGELSITNQTSNRVFEPSQNNPGHILNLSNGRLLSYEQIYDGRRRLRLTMRDLSNEKSVLIDSISPQMLEQNQQGFRVEWDRTMRYALIYYWQCKPENRCYDSAASSQVYLLDWERGTLQFLADRVVPHGNRSDFHINYPDSAIWSPDGRYAVLRDTVNHLIVVDAPSGQLLPSLDLPDVIAWQWAEKANALILLSDNARQLYRYDLQQQSLSPLNLSATLFSVSPDNHFMGLMWSQNDDLVDLKTQEHIDLPRHTRASGAIIDYLWHDSSQWFMTGEYTTLAGGGPGQSAVILRNTVGTVRREISVCGYLSTCAGFVPERIVSHLGEGSPKSVIPEPLYTLPHDNEYLSFAWSPDGTKIASYMPNDTGGKLTIWDMSSTPKRLTSFDSELSITSITWNQNGEFITLNSHNIEGVGYITEETWDIQTATRIAVRSRKMGKPIDSVTRIIPSPDRQYMVYARELNSDISIVDTATGETVSMLSSEQPRNILWSNDSQMLFIINADSSVMIWQDGEIKIIGGPYGIGYDSVSIDLQKKIIFNSGGFRRIRIWDAITSEQLPDLNWYATAVALSPDGTRLAAAGSSLVTIWDTSEFAP